MTVFQSFRAIGYVTDGTPASLQRRGIETFATVSIGKAWQVYNCSKLSLVFAGPQLEKNIRALASYNDFTFAAVGQSIAVFERAHQVSVWRAHSSKINVLLNVGHLLLSIDASGHVCIWDATKTTVNSPLPIADFHLGGGFTATCAVHPEAYVDKVLIGSEEGPLQLWNINSKKMIYEFKGFNSPVRACVSSPALDVVAVGCGDGKIYVHNLRYDETIVSFSHTTKGSVNALSFRSDGQPFLAAAGSSGVISIWNLEKQKLQTVIKEAHDAEISSLHFLANEPVLLSNSKDNSLKMWIFDSFDGEARLLRHRSGHSSPATCIRHYGEGKCLLSAGQDRAFRVFFTFQDQQSRELSQGHVAKRAKRLQLKEEDVKLPPIVAFDAAEIRERDWCNVVTCHLDHCAAYTWRLQSFVIGEHVLQPCPNKPSLVKACAISACGNYVFLGTASGVIERFNIQSGLQRGSYVDPSLEEQSAHSGAVHGLAADSINTCLISCGYDGVVKVWNFKAMSLKSSVNVGSPILKMAYHRGNGLAAVVTDDQKIRLYDLLTLRMVRLFEGHSDRITDIIYSEDGKWLLSSSMDATVRVWDVVAAKLLDEMHVTAAVCALSLSPTMDILATSHVNQNGINLWANRSMYTDTDFDIVTKPGDVADEQRSTATQITPELITLAMLPKSRWQGLVHLDTIKARNKPIAAPEKPERAPFFLPTLPSLAGTPVFAVKNKEVSDDKQSASALLPRRISTQPEFLQLIFKYSEDGACSELLEYIKGMEAPSLDAELRILQSVDEEAGDEEVVKSIGILLDFICKAMSLNREFELVQAFTQLVLKIHGEIITRDPCLRAKANSVREQHASTWRRLDMLFQNARCTISFLSDSNVY